MLTQEKAEKLVGRQATFSSRPDRQGILSGQITRVYLFEKSIVLGYIREIPSHWRVEIQVGESRHNIPWSWVKKLQPINPERR